MKRIEESIEIEAPVGVVWAVLSDAAGHQEWNPFVTRIDGEFVVGARPSIHIAPPGGKGMRFRPVVTAVDEERRLEWVGHLGVRGVFDGRHSFTLEQVDDTTTRMVQAEEFSGLLVPFTGSMLARTAEGFALMNQALRERAVAVAARAAR